MTTTRIEVTDALRAEAAKVNALARTNSLPLVYAALVAWAIDTLGAQKAAAQVIAYQAKLEAEKEVEDG